MNTAQFSSEDTASIFNSLIYLTDAGISDSDSLLMLAEEETRAEYSELYRNMAAKIDEGSTLDEAVDSSGAFPAYVARMIRVGRESGKVPSALKAIIRDAESRAEIDRRLRSALVYPAVLMLVMLVVMTVLLIYVLPVFDSVYARLGSGLMGIASGLLSFGQLIKKWIIIPAALFAVAVVFLAMFSGVRDFREKLLAHRAYRHSGKGIYGKISTARFARGMDLSVNSGMDIIEAVRISSGLLGDDPAVTSKAGKCIENLENGEPVSASLKESGLLPAAQCRILEAGILGGNGESAITHIADRLEEEAEASLDEIVERVEPAIVIVTAVLVGVILMSVMLPLINVMSALG